MKYQKISRKIFALLIIIMFSAPGIEIVKGETAVKELKPVAVADGFSLGGVGGTVSRRPKDGAVVYCPEKTLTDDVGSIEKGRCIEVLEGYSLDLIEELLKDNESLDLKVWGLVTEFEKENYAYINFIMPLNTELEQSGDDEPADQKTQPEDAEGDNVIPDDVIAMLRRSNGSLDTDKLSDFENQKKDSVYTRKTGLVKQTSDGRFYFTPDGLGRKIQTEKYYLQKCRTLENVVGVEKKSIGDSKFDVSGILSEYEGEKYLLLQRAVKVYNYGNLSPSR
ncbi:MAG: hypothetical protein ACIAQZ_12180 [Sedimentisphaeraceae bacterium JB056]